MLPAFLIYLPNHSLPKSHYIFDHSWPNCAKLHLHLTFGNRNISLSTGISVYRYSFEITPQDLQHTRTSSGVYVHSRSPNVHMILHKHLTFWPALLSNDPTSLSHRVKLSQVRQDKNFEDEITDMEKEMRKLEHCYYSSTGYHCTSGAIRCIHIFTCSLTTRILWTS